MRGVVVSCEHASPRVPTGVALGLSDAQLRSHAGWDPGALPVAEGLALGLSAPLLAGQVSRLVCDLHRREGHPEITRGDAWGMKVPGNLALELAAQRARVEAWHRPFRRALEAEVRRAIDEAGRCLHLSIHSFTPALSHGERDLDVGVLFRPERALASAVGAALLSALQLAGMDARANQPYTGLGEATTTWLEEGLEDRHYAGVEIELSQALDPAGLAQVGRVLVEGVRALSWEAR